MKFTVCGIISGIFGLVSLQAQTIIDCGKLDAGNVYVYRGEQWGQSVKNETVGSKKVLRLDWDSAKSSRFEFALTPPAMLPKFSSAKIQVKFHLPQGHQLRTLSFRLADKDGEIFQFGRHITAADTGWRDLTFSVDVKKVYKGNSWGGGRKGNKRLDFPVRFIGLAGDFNSKTGCGYLQVGEVLLSDVKFDKVVVPGFETGSEFNVLTPSSPAPSITFFNHKEHSVSGKLFCKAADVDGNIVEEFEREITLPALKKQKYPLRKPDKKGVYYVNFRFLENTAGSREIKKEFRFCIMDPAGKTPGRGKGFLFGICAHSPGQPHAVIRKEAKAAALCGAKIVRQDLLWQHIQPTPERWDFSKYDPIIELFDKENIEIQGVYCYLPRWAAAKEQKTFDRNYKGRYQRPDYELWRKYVRTVAQRYKGKIRYMEVWNEPDHLGFANFPVDEYIEMMKIAYTETKKIDPSITVLTGGYTALGIQSPRFNKEHMPRTLTEGRGFYDVVAFHGHGRYDNYTPQIKQLLQLKKKLNVKAPWYANETAISSILVGELVQAETLFKKFLYSWANGSIGYTWYILRNSGFDPGNNEHNFGLLTRDFQPKAVYAAYNNLAKLYRDGEFIRPLRLEKNIAAYLFRAKDGNMRLAVWNDSAGSSGVMCCLQGVDGKAEIIDIFGNAEPLAVDNGKLIFTAGAKPITISFPAKDTDKIKAGVFFKQDQRISVTPGEKSRAVLTFRNPTSGKINIEYTLQAPKGIKLIGAKQKIALNAGRTRRITTVFDTAADFRAPGSGAVELLLDLNINGKWKHCQKIPVDMVIELPAKLPEQPTFVLREPQQITSFVPNVPENARYFWQGPPDLSAEVRLARKKRSLAVQINVTDDKHHQTAKGGELWREDSVQIAMQLPGQRGIWEFGFAHTVRGSELYCWCSPAGQDGGKVLKKIRLITSRDDKTKQTQYYAEIPFDALGAKAGTPIRFNLIVNDNDGKMRESCIGPAPGIAESKNPSLYPVIKFR